MKTLKLTQTMFAVIAGVAISTAVPAFAQENKDLATVYGHVTNPAGFPQSAGEVSFTVDVNEPEDKMRMTNVTKLDANGDYKAVGVLPGKTYFVYVMQDGKRLDRQQITPKIGDNLKLDFDMSREEYLKAMTPEQKKALEDYKKNASAAMSANKVVGTLNATLKSVRADLDAAKPAAGKPEPGDTSKDVADMKAALAQKPEESVLWIVYGDTLSAQGDHLAYADKQAHKSIMSDDDVIKAYTDAADAYQKGVDFNKASKKPTPADQAVALNSLGNTYAKLGKVQDAQTAFEGAVALDPTKAGMYYNNEAAILINNQQNDGALAAADKAIAADPNRADPYYIKGKVLIAKATFDNKTQKLVPPDGCVDAYQHFLAIAPPDDKKIPEVKEILAALGEKIDTKYNANQKKK